MTSIVRPSHLAAWEDDTDAEFRCTTCEASESIAWQIDITTGGRLCNTCHQATTENGQGQPSPCVSPPMSESIAVSLEAPAIVTVVMNAILGRCATQDAAEKRLDWLWENGEWKNDGAGGRAVLLSGTFVAEKDLREAERRCQDHFRDSSEGITRLPDSAHPVATESSAQPLTECLRLASPEEERIAPHMLYAFHRHLIDGGKAEATAKQYTNTIFAWLKWDRYSPEAMTSSQYAEIIRQRHSDQKSHGFHKCALAAFCRFWCEQSRVGWPEVAAEDLAKVLPRQNGAAGRGRASKSCGAGASSPMVPGRGRGRPAKSTSACSDRPTSPDGGSPAPLDESLLAAPAEEERSLPQVSVAHGQDEAQTSPVDELEVIAAKRQKWELPATWRVTVIAVSPGGTGYGDDELDERLGRAADVDG